MGFLVENSSCSVEIPVGLGRYQLLVAGRNTDADRGRSTCVRLSRHKRTTSTFILFPSGQIIDGLNSPRKKQ